MPITFSEYLKNPCIVFDLTTFFILLEREDLNDYAEYIERNSPVRFTDVNADPFLNAGKEGRKVSEYKDTIRSYKP